MGRKNRRKNNPRTGLILSIEKIKDLHWAENEPNYSYLCPIGEIWFQSGHEWVKADTTIASMRKGRSLWTKDDGITYERTSIVAHQSVLYEFSHYVR